MKNHTKILIVEDSPTQAEKLKFILEDENYLVLLAYNGTEALNILNNKTDFPDLIITDIVMPGMNGFELTKKIKTDKKLKDIPVILLTSLSNPTDILKGLESGANNFISKPYDEEFIVKRIENILQQNKISKNLEKKDYLEFIFKGERYNIPSNSQKVLGFLISSYETAVDKNLELLRLKDELLFLNTKLEDRVKDRTAMLSEEIITRKKIEMQLFHLNTVLKAIRNVNQLITHERNPNILISEACQKLVEYKGYHFARIVIFDDKGKIKNYAESSLDNNNKSGYQYKEIDELPYCMRKATDMTEILIFESSNNECINCKANPGSKNYYTLSLRLEFEKKIYGIVSVSIPDSNIFDSEEASLFHELAGDISFALATIEEEKRRKAAEESLHESEVRNSTIINNSPNILLIHKEGILEYINDLGEKIIGYGKEEMLGKSVFDYLSEESKPIVFENIQKQIKGEIIPPYEANLIAKSGKIIPFFVQASMIPFRQDKSFLVVLTDISNIKKYQSELLHAKEEAEKNNLIKSYFLANMSHEMRTPMVGILGFANLLVKEVYKEDLRDMAQMIVSSGNRLMDTLNLILDLSSIEAGKLVVLQDEVSLPYVVYDSVGLFSVAARQKNIFLETKILDEDVTAYLDESLTTKIINNILNNAIKFTDNGGITIEVDSIVTGEEISAVIRVIDTGIGISDESQQLIFEEFRQASEGKDRNFEGTGLGLTISRKYCEAMGGRISVSSTLGIGTTFTISFPALNYNLKAEKKDSMSKTFEDKEYVEEKRSLPKVLLVEDDLASRILTGRYLKDLYDVDFASNGETAIEMAKNVQYTIILMDINLGKGKNGLDVTNFLRQTEKYENAPIIAMTAFAMKGDREDFISKGCSDYISKPFDKNDILELLEKYL